SDSTTSSPFFSSYAHLRDLHSFPTRRSSDLDEGGQGPARESRHPSGLPPSDADLPLRVWQRVHHEVPQVGQRRLQGHLEAVQGRSEEHTSELQSRFDLVCRLLLEKKNK